MDWIDVAAKWTLVLVWRRFRVVSEAHEGVGEQHGAPPASLRETAHQRQAHRVPVLQRLLVPPACTVVVHYS